MAFTPQEHQPDLSLPHAGEREPSAIWHAAYDGLQANSGSRERSKGTDVLTVADKVNPTDAQHEAAIKQAASDLASGKWSEKTAESFRKLFIELSSAPGANLTSIFQGLREYGTKINEVAEKLGSKFQLNLAGAMGEHGMSFYYIVRGPGIDDAKAADAMQADKDAPTAALVGGAVIVRKPPVTPKPDTKI
jgi:hypothetical protein